MKYISKCAINNTFSYSAGSTTAVSWDNAPRNEAGFWDSGNPTRLTMPNPAKTYIKVTAFISFTRGASDKTAYFFIKKNGSIIRTTMIMQDKGCHTLTTGWIGGINAGDYFEVFVNIETTAGVVYGETYPFGKSYFQVEYIA